MTCKFDFRRLLSLVWVILMFTTTNVHTQTKVILDTDPGYDPDDVGCMAMLHTMANLGECEILAMMNCTDHKESPLALSAINTFYNRPAIPIGDYRGYKKKIDAPTAFYSHHLAEAYPRTLEKWDDSNDAVRLYREILASADEASITIVIIGTMHNFYALLRSESCTYSDLSGVELVREKVEKVVTMGGNFMAGQGHDRTNWGGSDMLCSYTSWSCLDEDRNAMCRYVIENCPAPFIASGWEVGCGDYHDAGYGTVVTGPGLKELPENHITRVSYEYHFKHRENKTDISRHSNDQCALHYAIRGEGKNYTAFLDGSIDLSEHGECQWSQKPNKGQGYIQKKRVIQLIAAEIETLMMGTTPEPDNTPPSIPERIRYSIDGDKLLVEWDPSYDDTPGSWVVAYRISHNNTLLFTAYGHQWITDSMEPGKYELEVRAVNASGTLSDPGFIQVVIR